MEITVLIILNSWGMMLTYILLFTIVTHRYYWKRIRVLPTPSNFHILMYALMSTGFLFYFVAQALVIPYWKKYYLLPDGRQLWIAISFTFCLNCLFVSIAHTTFATYYWHITRKVVYLITDRNSNAEKEWRVTKWLYAAQLLLIVGFEGFLIWHTIHIRQRGE